MSGNLRVAYNQVSDNEYKKCLQQKICRLLQNRNRYQIRRNDNVNGDYDVDSTGDDNCGNKNDDRVKKDDDDDDNDNDDNCVD
ncbi:unnamed protein product [Euphydryas editha]|uniref:Uncharacterized protein n=1 Tax=Euphydryas editha TaxID=104508 RepID=A0AAU9UBX8_EUPED|nr:unnamed protein product [Euphydryas editha]